MNVRATLKSRYWRHSLFEGIGQINAILFSTWKFEPPQYRERNAFGDSANVLMGVFDESLAYEKWLFFIKKKKLPSEDGSEKLK
jgi:hypothetical protein